MRLISLIAVVLALVVSSGCISGAPLLPSDNTSPPSSSITPSERVPRIAIDELLQKINSQADILIVDCRIDVEKLFADGHIPGAVPVPLSEIIDGQWLPPANQNQEIIFYCT